MKRFLSSLLASFTNSSKSSRHLSQQRRARLQVECLEERQLLSAAATHWAIEQQPGNITAGQSITFKVEAETASGSVVNTGNSPTVSLASNPTGTALTGSLNVQKSGDLLSLR